MAFLKGMRESPGMVVTTGEHPRQGRCMVTPSGAHARNDAKDVIYGDAPPVVSMRPPLQKACVRVELTPGAPLIMMKSKVGPGRQRRLPDEAEAEQRRQYEEQAAQAYQEARLARRGTREVQARGQVHQQGAAQTPEAAHSPAGAGRQPGHESRSFCRRPSREGLPATAAVDPELAEMLRGIERTAEAERCFWDAQEVAEKGRVRNRGSVGVFGNESEEAATLVPPARQWAPAAQGRGSAEELDPMLRAKEEARSVRERAHARNRGGAGGIFAVDGPLPPPPPRDGSHNIIG